MTMTAAKQRLEDAISYAYGAVYALSDCIMSAQENTPTGQLKAELDSLQKIISRLQQISTDKHFSQ